ncbi:type II toxin-antitoxin system RelE/ParE family toxin [Flavobacterium salilacus subsp. salilacus]|uniref:type II toxin-antitoxin system RelE/ParE family toxin n=1 Tax=Flavobacterium TaxID=237 RepID=UPI001074B114|nr:MULTISPECIES: type II toxin-antitoxin system RelE/ParE family toxin [Flavobacterium]KAF2518496.1 type II toxin-antitoxin system RelE/ParE family toxin [Flavobacterium salilacus subsp. salilacus]MBE1615136.1 type II toxin-antitoxin system RelE/ParE family toxin [Flavobacterium sp. SaA2.13]
MAKRLIWTLEAQQNRIAIFEYWNNRNKSKNYSRKLNGIFRIQIDLLLKHPQIGIATNIPNVRCRTVKDYKIVYLTESNKIVLLAIWDTRQNPELLTEKIKSVNK